MTRKQISIGALLTQVCEPVERKLQSDRAQLSDEQRKRDDFMNRRLDRGFSLS